MYEFQKLYQSKGQTSLISREELINRLALYDYSDPELLGSVYEHLLSDTDCRTLSYEHFKANEQKFYHALSTGFYKYVFEEKGINFATANDLLVAAWSCFDNDTEEESGSLGEFFKLNYDSFNDYVHDRFSILSNKKVHAAAVLWGLPYVYDFLRINQLVSEETALQALQHINEMKMDLIDGQEDAVFDYSFVHSWGRPESVDEDGFLREKEFFERAFYEIVDVKEYLPEEYYIQQRRSYKIKRNEATVVYDEPKTGRNEPCPCGSEKKFKKCCDQG